MPTHYNNIKFFSSRFLVFLFFVLVFGRGSSLVVNFDPRINAAGFLLYILCIIYLLGKTNINHIKRSKTAIYAIFWIVLAVWFFAHLFILDKGLPIMPYSFFLLHIYTGILLIKTYHKDIVVYYEKAMVFFAYVSLIGWAIESAGGSSLLLKSPILLENSAGVGEYSLILYTLSVDPARIQAVYGGIIRNSGCAWEPGLYSVMLCIAILFNIFQNKKNIFNKRLIVLLIALITTFSTTGYVMAIVIFAGYYLSGRKIGTVKRIIYLSIIVVGSIYIYNLPFISEKINDDANTESFSTEEASYVYYEEKGKNYTTGRFEGIVLDYMNFKDKPIMGYGLTREASYIYNKISPVIITSNGIAKPFAMFGIILGVILLAITYKSTAKLSNEYLFAPPYLLFIVIMLGSVSYMFDSTPIMRAIELYALYIPFKLIR